MIYAIYIIASAIMAFIIAKVLNGSPMEQILMATLLMIYLNTVEIKEQKNK